METAESQLLTVLILIISQIEFQVRKAGLYLFVSSFAALGGLWACYQNDKLAKKKPWCDLNCASNVCSWYWDITARIRFLSACCTLSTLTLPRTKYLSADFQNETKLLIEISRSSLRISALWSRFQLSDLSCSVLLAHTSLSLRRGYVSLFHHPLTWALTLGLLCLMFTTQLSLS